MRLASVLLVLAACNTGSGELHDGTTQWGDADADADADADTDTDTDTDTDIVPPDPLVISNPTWELHAEMGSLVYVRWDQDRAEDVHIEYSFDTGVWLSSPTLPAVAGANERLVVGIPFATTSEWRIVSATSTLDGVAIQTGPLPPRLPVASLEVFDEAAVEPTGKYLLTSINEDAGGWIPGVYWTFILDRQGRVVWARFAPQQHWTLFAQVSVTGDYMMWDESTLWSNFDDGAGSTIHKTWLDLEFEEVATPGLHHAFVQLPDGTLAWGSQDHGGREALVEKAPGQLDETILWTCEDDWPGSGFCESNGLFYSPSRDTYLYSFYTNSSIVEIDRVTGTSLWSAGTISNSYDFVPPSSQFSWQHGLSWTDAGTLLLSTEGRSGGGPITTWVREYEVDEVAETLTDVWNYDSEVTAETNGDTWRLANGNTLHTIGAAGHIKEVDALGATVWHLDFGDDFLLGRGEFIEDLYDLVSPP